MSPVEKAIIDRCVRIVYREYLNDPKPENMPLLNDLYNAIRAYAEQLAFKTPEHSELFHAVMALPQKYRVPLFLHYYEGYSCEEISQFLGIPNATVRTRLRRGREQLKTDLQEANNNV